jgi:hypothetical protein
LRDIIMAPTYPSTLRLCCWLGDKWITILLAWVMVAGAVTVHGVERDLSLN